jgi:hypothetical protein
LRAKDEQSRLFSNLRIFWYNTVTSWLEHRGTTVTPLNKSVGAAIGCQNQKIKVTYTYPVHLDTLQRINASTRKVLAVNKTTRAYPRHTPRIASNLEKIPKYGIK